MEGLELAFAFSAVEFLEEEMEKLEENYGSDLAFIKNGKFVHNKEAENHPYEWWASQKDIDELNSLLAKKHEKS